MLRQKLLLFLGGWWCGGSILNVFFVTVGGAGGCGGL